jgi:hypothetical protein
MKQIEYWVHQYRAVLLKQDIDKGKYPNETYIQEIAAIKLIPIDRAGSLSKISTGKTTFVSEIAIPNTIDFNYEDGILFVGTLTGEEINFIPESRANYQQYKKYANNEACAYLKDSHIYVNTDRPISYIALRGIFEIPTEVMQINLQYSNNTGYAVDLPYPIPYNLISPLKEMILKKEFNVIINSPTDNTNDTTNKVSTNIEK